MSLLYTDDMSLYKFLYFHFIKCFFSNFKNFYAEIQIEFEDELDKLINVDAILTNEITLSLYFKGAEIIDFCTFYLF